MISVKLFGVLRIDTGLAELSCPAADNVSALFPEISKQTGITEKELKNLLIFVNGKSILSQKMFKTKLNDGDTVSLMSPVSGG